MCTKVLCRYKLIQIYSNHSSLVVVKRMWRYGRFIIYGQLTFDVKSKFALSIGFQSDGHCAVLYKEQEECLVLINQVLINIWDR